MTRALLVACGAIALFVAVVAVAAWEPWASKERARELAWLETFAAWSDGELRPELRRRGR